MEKYFGILLIIIGAISFIGIIIMSNSNKNKKAQLNTVGDDELKKEQEKLEKLKQIKEDLDKELHEIETAADFYFTKDGLVKVKRSYLDANFMKGAIMSPDIFLAPEDADGFVTLSRQDFDDLQIKKMQYEENEDKLHRITELNNKGIELEKAGNIEEAIKVYEETIFIDYPARHSYDRLIQIYRQRNDLVNEKRICAVAAVLFENEPKYKKRYDELEKLLTL